jgi:hypothetical protein
MTNDANNSANPMDNHVTILASCYLALSHHRGARRGDRIHRDRRGRTSFG